MISLLLRESEVKPRKSVNNKDIIQMYLGYSLLISQRSTPNNASVYNEHIYTMASTGSVTYVLGMQQYGSLPYCVLPLSVLQYITVLQCMIKFEKRTHHVFKTCFSSKG